MYVFYFHSHICNEPKFSSNHEESDSRVWLHCLQSQHDHVLVFSPDPDTYCIDLVALSGEEGRLKKDVIVQMCNSPDKNEYRSMNVFLCCLRSDPDLDAMEKDDLPSVIQTLFICSSSDYTSHFFKCGKSTFLSTFFHFAEFITGPQSVDTLRNASVDSEDNMLAFYGLIGCVYFKKFQSVMPSTSKTPEQLFHSFHEDGDNAKNQHENWMNSIRESSWEKIESEDQLMPSNNALEYHWQRCCLGG